MAGWTPQDLQTIRAAIANGTKAVTFADGRRKEYQSLQELLAAEKVIAAALQMEADTLSGRSRRRSTPYYRSGL